MPERQLTRRAALLAVLAAPATASAQLNPYSPNVTNPWMTIDLGRVEQITIRLPQGTVSVTAAELWQALQPAPKEKAEG